MSADATSIRISTHKVSRNCPTGHTAPVYLRGYTRPHFLRMLLLPKPLRGVVTGEWVRSCFPGVSTGLSAVFIVFLGRESYHSYIMNRTLAGLLVLSLVIAGGYWYRFAESKCNLPVAYDIGDVDERFDISTNEIRAALTDAESLWEDATGHNLFTYTEGATFKVNFVFDDRQATAIKEETVREELNTKEATSAHIRSEYERLASEYKKLKESYEARVAAYEKALAAHNAEVESWNKKGGAPESVFKDLTTTKVALQKEHTSLNAMTSDLNRLVSSINKLGDVGNQTVEDYNDDVTWYNSMFGGEREFTQGEYQGSHINIYQFDDGSELRRVLAHEFGHALSLGHVEGDASVMHYLLEGKTADAKLSGEDLAEFNRVCGSAEPWYKAVLH